MALPYDSAALTFLFMKCHGSEAITTLAPPLLRRRRIDERRKDLTLPPGHRRTGHLGARVNRQITKPFPRRDVQSSQKTSVIGEIRQSRENALGCRHKSGDRQNSQQNANARKLSGCATDDAWVALNDVPTAKDEPSEAIVVGRWIHSGGRGSSSPTPRNGQWLVQLWEQCRNKWETLKNAMKPYTELGNESLGNIDVQLTANR
ncbi:uncharacterized protein EI90DRAFT_3286477 [Cantharellus anzutake]|uniref:uncharacterized protein n=1 Tax=Cantharellus anzutake TaxID=1750568 RepID=UPI0019063E42|nr:uncharacterized protein EI90DRAFT_3286477 [Cantharellus anzutake]KAF8338875.1 hypothetical protein EI90DRAFT_3286477 [Cantharellus anzutake]